MFAGPPSSNSVLTANTRVLRDATFQGIARRHACTPEQLAMRLALQMNMVILTGTKDFSGHAKQVPLHYCFERTHSHPCLIYVNMFPSQDLALVENYPNITLLPQEDFTNLMLATSTTYAQPPNPETTGSNKRVRRRHMPQPPRPREYGRSSGV